MNTAKLLDVVDDLHGVAVPDPYRWLEDVESDEVLAWVTEENRRARSLLDALPARPALQHRLAELFGRPHALAPWRRGDNWFQFRNDGTQELDVLYAMTAPGDDGRVLLDPNQLSADHSLAVLFHEVSWDGQLLAWQSIEAGSSWGTVRFRDVATGDDLDDEIAWVRLGFTWAPDSGSLYYATFPPPSEGARFKQSSQNELLLLHRLGAPQEDDEVVFERPDRPKWLFAAPRLSDDHRHLLLEATEGTDATKTWLFVCDLEGAGGDFIELTHGDAFYRLLGSRDGALYVRTDRGAPRGRVVAIDLADPSPQSWRELVAEGEGSLTDPYLPGARAGGSLVLVDIVHSLHRLRLVDLDDGAIREVALPAAGSVVLAPQPADDDIVHLELHRFAAPPLLARLDAREGAIELLEAPPDEFEDAVVEQDFAPSTGGARVPLVQVRRRDVAANGDLPVIMTGYGGFGLSWTPSFRPWQVARAWIELGGLFVSTNLRGGSEYGRAWYDAGRRGNKQNVFDDFAACARHLVDTGWTRAGRIAINGASNGGLLVAATEVQYPELFGACIPEVGVLDMLRYHLFTSGIFWVGDYGNADDADDFQMLHGYSPVHNVRASTSYPATLVMASYNDDHVLPSHSFKFAAALQAAQAGKSPILLRTELKTGHGGGKPVSMQVSERADVLAFAAAAVEVGT